MNWLDVLFRCQRSSSGYWWIWQPAVSNRYRWEIWSKNARVDFSSCKYIFFSFCFFLCFCHLYFFFPPLLPVTEYCKKTALRRHGVPPRSSVCNWRLWWTVPAQFCGVSGLHCGWGRGLVHCRHHECPPWTCWRHNTWRFVILMQGFIPKLSLKSENNFSPNDFALCRYDLRCRGLWWQPTTYQHGAIRPKHWPVEHARRHADCSGRRWSGGCQRAHILSR